MATQEYSTVPSRNLHVKSDPPKKRKKPVVIKRGPKPKGILGGYGK